MINTPSRALARLQDVDIENDNDINSNSDRDEGIANESEDSGTDYDARPALISFDIDVTQTMVVWKTQDIFGDPVEFTLLIDDSNKNKTNLKLFFCY